MTAGSTGRLLGFTRPDQIAQQSFDSEQQIELLVQAHAIVVDEAAWAFIVHDLNPRAMSPKVKGFQPAQSWYQDFTKVTAE